MLRRERGDADRRGAYAVLTPEGQQALERAWPTYGRGIQAHFARYLSDDEVVVLTKALTRVAQAEGHPFYADAR